jgi:hypothetical protein
MLQRQMHYEFSSTAQVLPFFNFVGYLLTDGSEINRLKYKLTFQIMKNSVELNLKISLIRPLLMKKSFITLHYELFNSDFNKVSF